MKRWISFSAWLGAALWIAAPWLPVGAPPSFGSIEHVFLSLPLVAAPLALLVLSTLLGPCVVAERLQPFAACLVLASFCGPKGAVAGGLAAPWLFMALLVAAHGVRRIPRRPGVNLSNVSLLAAHVFLPVGAVWLVLSRLGVGPRGFSAATVFLAALHFHFSGFTLQIVIAAVGRKLQAAAPRLGTFHRCLAVGAIAALLAIAAGNAVASPALKLAGVALMVLSTIALATSTMALARVAADRRERALLLVSAGSIAGAMILAGIYGAGELTGNGWIGITRMVSVHGLLNALGFTLCGLSAHLERTASRQH